jgi:hypothetical protein
MIQTSPCTDEKRFPTHLPIRLKDKISRSVRASPENSLESNSKTLNKTKITFSRSRNTFSSTNTSNTFVRPASKRFDGMMPAVENLNEALSKAMGYVE